MSCAVLLCVLCAATALAEDAKELQQGGKWLKFHVFSLRPDERAPGPVRVLAATSGEVSRLGPLLEYLVQRVQSLMSHRVPADVSGAVLEPSAHSPGTYELRVPLAS